MQEDTGSTIAGNCNDAAAGAAPFSGRSSPGLPSASTRAINIRAMTSFAKNVIKM